MDQRVGLNLFNSVQHSQWGILRRVLQCAWTALSLGSPHGFYTQGLWFPSTETPCTCQLQLTTLSRAGFASLPQIHVVPSHEYCNDCVPVIPFTESWGEAFETPFLSLCAYLKHLQHVSDESVCHHLQQEASFLGSNVLCVLG